MVFMLFLERMTERIKEWCLSDQSSPYFFFISSHVLQVQYEKKKTGYLLYSIV